MQVCWQEKQREMEEKRKEKERLQKEKALRKAAADPNVSVVSHSEELFDEESGESGDEEEDEGEKEEDEPAADSGDEPLSQTLANLGKVAGIPEMEVSTKKGRKKMIEEQRAIQASIEAGTAAGSRARGAKPRSSSDVSGSTSSPRGDDGQSKKKSKVSADGASSTGTAKPKAKPASAKPKADLKSAMAELAGRGKKH